MTNHVPNLELCKRLKEAGYPQVQEKRHGQYGYIWYHPTDETARLFYSRLGLTFAMDGKVRGQDFFPIRRFKPENVCTAPLATELLDSIPRWIDHRESNDLDIAKSDNYYIVRYLRNGPNTHARSLPDALAEMWLWLKSEGYL